MYIYQVIIYGFKSFKEKTVLEPFDSRYNVIVGRNGAGKSTIFDAIQFVLSEKYNYHQDVKIGLLHRSTGPSAVEAYVEVILDNSDGRIGIGSKRISISRVISATKDQYFLNKKIVPKAEIFSLLESVGFSTSNPYYIIKQGMINQIATSIDSYRLEVIQQIAGAKVYLKRYKESQNLMEVIELCLNDIYKKLKVMEEKKDFLAKEKEELEQYNKFDKLRRSIEFLIKDRRLKENKRKLLKVESSREELTEEQDRYILNFQEIQEKKKVFLKNLNETKKKILLLMEEQSVLEKERERLTKEKFRLQLQIKDLTAQNSSQEKIKNDFALIEQSIIDKKKDLERINPEYNSWKKQEQEITNELVMKEQRRKELYAKQNRKNDFRSKDERDNWLKNELQALNKQLKDKAEYNKTLEQDFKKHNAIYSEIKQKIANYSNEKEVKERIINDAYKFIKELQNKMEQFKIEINELRRKENSHQQESSLLKDELFTIDQKLRSIMGQGVLNGCHSVNKVLDTFIKRGGEEAEIASKYYGLVIENFSCEENFSLAVNVTAGKNLFNHIVESANIATIILKEMSRQNLPGMVNFMALNMLNVKEQKYPKNDKALPMINYLNYEKKYDKAMRFIFGKTLVCANMEVSKQMALSSSLNCVTLTGDQTSSKGTLTGGYYNPSRNAFKIYKSRIEINKQLNTLDQSLNYLNKKVQNFETEIIKSTTQIENTETQIIQDKIRCENLKRRLGVLHEELSNTENLCDDKSEMLNKCKTDLKVMENLKQSLETELQQDFLSQLSSEEMNLLESLNSEIISLQKKNSEAIQNRIKLEEHKTRLDNTLQNYLRRREDILQSIEEYTQDGNMITIKQHELDNIQLNLEKNKEELAILENKKESLNKKQNEQQASIENLEISIKNLQENIDNLKEKFEALSNKENLLNTNIGELQRYISELKTLPKEELYKNYLQTPEKLLFNELKVIQEQLKQNCVNNKALNQYIKLEEKFEQGSKRYTEIVEWYNCCKDLIYILEEEKNQSIIYTFKQIANYFRTIFKTLVPTGHAKLVKKLKDPNQPEDSDNFIGIGIKASFLSDKVEAKNISSFSGGQKSLIALALIFAIQKCDPAPFYLFDEIDQALDTSHRNAVVDLIQELSKNTQFLATTFRPEFLKHANKVYSVTCTNKVSHIKCITVDAAKDFVET